MKMKKILLCCMALYAAPALAQSAVTLPIAANTIADIGNGPIKVRMIAGNASIFTSQGSGIGSTSGASTTLTLTATPATPPIVGGLISGAGIASGTTVTAYNGTTGITLSAAMTVAGGTAVAWGAACPSTPPSIVIQASPQADYYVMYTQARVCAVSPGGPVNTLLIDPIFYDQTTPNSATKGAAVNPVSFGADPTGLADSAPAFSAACAASPYVQFPPGRFLMLSKVTCNTINVATNSAFQPSMTITGSGSSTTRLNFANSTDGLEIDYTTINASATVAALTIETNQSPGGNGLTLKLPILNSNAAVQRPTTLYDLNIEGSTNPPGANGWLTGINIQNVSNVQISGVYIVGKQPGGPFGTGIEFIGNTGLSSPAVGLTINNCIILNQAVGIQMDALTQGVFVINTYLTTVGIGILVPAGIAALTELTVSNSQINPGGTTSTAGIDLESGISAVSIVNTLFILPAGNDGIKSGVAGVAGVSIGSNTFAGVGGGIGVDIAASSTNNGFLIGGNNFQTLTTGVNIAASSDYVVVSNNGFNSNGTNIANASTGTHNRIEGNAGYNPVGISAAANVCASPCTITAGPSPEDHYIRQSATFNAAVTKGGNALCTVPSAAVACPIRLGPNESLVVTWTTTTPTDTKDVH